MCGITGAVAERDVVPILIEGLKRLEYRGYDSAGLTILNNQSGELKRQRVAGKVHDLEAKLDDNPLSSHLGIAHTRWATHGKPSQENAHPHLSKNTVAVVHNGIIENYSPLRQQLEQHGYTFHSETDTEVIAHQIHYHLQQGKDLYAAVQATVQILEGTYAIAVVSSQYPGRLLAARRGSPLIIGVGVGEHFVASDIAALISVTQRVIFLEEGDIADLRRDHLKITDTMGNSVQRPEHTSQLQADAVERGEYRHYMHKEIFEQARAITDTLEGRVHNGRVLEAAFGPNAQRLFKQIEKVQIIACGTSYHAAMQFKYYIGNNRQFNIVGAYDASEFSELDIPKNGKTLFIICSQSGETRDLINTLEICKKHLTFLIKDSPFVKGPAFRVYYDVNF